MPALRIFSRVIFWRSLAEHQRLTRAAETSVAKLATALNHSRGLEAGFKYYQALDIAQSRAIKRRDNALRQIERWRKGLGASARRLPDHLLVKRLLAQHYGVEQFLADAEADASAGDALEAAAPLSPTGKAAEAAAPNAPTGEVAVAAAPALAAASEAGEPAPVPRGNVAEPAPLIAATGDVAVSAAPARARAGEAAEAPPPLAPTGELAAATASAGAPAAAAAQAAPPLAAPAAAAENAPPVRAPSEAAEQHHHRSRSQPGCAQARLDGACAVPFLAEPTKSVAVNANRRL